MAKYEFSPLEKKMLDFDFASLDSITSKVTAGLTPNGTELDLSATLCEAWSKIDDFVRPLKHIPGVGKYVEIIVDILDSICKKK